MLTLLTLMGVLAAEACLSAGACALDDAGTPMAPELGPSPYVEVSATAPGGPGLVGDLEPSWLEAGADAVAFGASLRYMATPQTRLAAALNPDFTQIEPDATKLVLNRRVAWRRPERRTDFLEDNQALVDPLKTLYTRGVVQPLYVLGATQTSGLIEVGAMSTLDMNPQPSVSWRSTPGWKSEDVEGAMAATQIARVSVNAGLFDLGAIATDKRLVGGSGSSNTLVGVDLRSQKNRPVVVTAALQGARTTDVTERVRPGYRAVVTAAHPSARGASWKASAVDVSDDFRAETGFLTDTALRLYKGDVAYGVQTQGVMLTPKLEVSLRQDRDGDRRLRQRTSTAISWGEGMDLWARLQVHNVTEGQEATGPMVSGAFEYRLARGALTQLRVGGGYGYDYNFSRRTVALGGDTHASFALSPSGHNLFLGASAQLAWLHPQEGAAERGAILRAEATWRLAPSLSLCLIEEVGHNTAWDARWSASFFQLHLTRGSHLGAWLGYRTTPDTGQHGTPENRLYFRISRGFGGNPDTNHLG